MPKSHLALELVAAALLLLCAPRAESQTLSENSLFDPFESVAQRIVTGRVVDDRGRPVQSFTIGLGHVPMPVYMTSLIEIPDPCDPRSPRPASTRTLRDPQSFFSMDGRFSYLLPTEAAGGLYAVVEEDGVQRESAPRKVDEMIPGAELVLTISRSARVAGTVVDDAGAPVAGATVTLAYYGWAPLTGSDLVAAPNFMGPSPEWKESATADGDGRFRFLDLPASQYGAYGTLRASEGSSLSLLLDLTLQPGLVQEDVELRLVPCGRLTIDRTCDPSRPFTLGGITVYSIPDGMRRRQLCLGGPPAEVDGVPRSLTEIGPIEAGVHRICFSLQEPDLIWRDYQKDVEVLPGSTTHVSLAEVLGQALFLDIEVGPELQDPLQAPSAGLVSNGAWGQRISLQGGRCTLSVLEPGEVLLALYTNSAEQRSCCTGSRILPISREGPRSVRLTRGTGRVLLVAAADARPNRSAYGPLRPYLTHEAFPEVRLYCEVTPGTGSLGDQLLHVSPGRYRAHRPDQGFETLPRESSAVFEIRAGETVTVELSR